MRRSTITAVAVAALLAAAMLGGNVLNNIMDPILRGEAAALEIPILRGEAFVMDDHPEF